MFALYMLLVIFRGVIKFVADRGLLVWLSSHIEGFIPKTFLGMRDAETYQSVFKVGMGVRAVVRNANEKRASVFLSIQGEVKNRVVYRFLY